MKKKLLSMFLAAALGMTALMVPALGASAEESILTAPEHSALSSYQSTAKLQSEEASKVATIQIGVPDAYLNNKRTLIDPNNKKVTPIIMSSKTMVPLRFCATAMGGTCTYISDKDFITVKVGDKVAKFKIKSKELQILDKTGKLLNKITMDVAATKVSGRVLVPTRAISQGLGSQVFYKKIGSDEFVVVSDIRLTEDEYHFQMMQLRNLKKVSYTNKQKTCTITLPGSWEKHMEDGGIMIFESVFYKTVLLAQNLTPASEYQYNVKATKEEWEDVLGDSISNFSKTTINNKKAVFFTYDDSHWCYIVSSKAAICIYAPSASMKFSNFKTFCQGAKLLK